MNSIEFGTSVAVGDFESLVRTSGYSGADSIFLDFSKSTWIEMTTLQLVTSMVSKRDRDGLKTKIGLPKGDRGRNARDALRAWKWPSAIQSISKHPFTELVTEEDFAYFRHYGGDPGEQSYAIMSEANRTIAFHTWRISDYRDKIRISDEVVELDEFKPILQVLNRRLQPPEDHDDPEIAEHMMSRIVFEAMTNAIRHPEAKNIQVASTVRDQGGTSFFTITFWDDGNSIWRTLQESVAGDAGLKLVSNERFKTNYEVKADNWDLAEFEGNAICSNDLPNSNSPAEHFFLSSLFPGVTSNPSGEDESYHTKLANEAPELARRGMGLFALVRAAVHTFGGSVAFRNSGLFMNVKKSARHKKDPRRYSVKIAGQFDREDDFVGNMITIRLPLKSGYSAK